jgi:uncharacterized protein
VRTVAAVVIPVLWSGAALPRLRLGLRGRTAANAAFATGYAVAFRTGAGAMPHVDRSSIDAHIGPGLPTIIETCCSTRQYAKPASHIEGCRGRAENCTQSSIRGLLWGTVLAVLVLAGYWTLLAIPATRTRLAEFTAREPEVGLLEWVTIHIPLGTVYTEELIFRTTLAPLLDETTGRFGALLGPATFGLWHITPARAAHDNVPATIAATTLAGLLLSWLRRHTGSTFAPALAHLALNAGGAIAPHAARRSTEITQSGRSDARHR